MNKRIDYLDIAKGILIITVVLSHSSFEYAQYMYWFHMPAFFIISGILHKRNIDFKQQLLKFYIPYLIFSIVDISTDFIIYPGSISLNNFLDLFSRYIFSGKAARGVFWFIPALLISKFLFYKMQKFLKTPLVVTIIALGYLGAHFYSKNFIPDTITLIDEKYWVVLGLDVVPICLSYYAIGFYSKNIVKYISSKYIMALSILACFYLIYINTEMGFYYYLNIKDAYFKYPILDLIYPLTFTILILSISNFIKNNFLGKFLSYCGFNSLIIMYLHKPIGELFIDNLPEINWFIVSSIAILVSLAISMLLGKKRWSSVMFKGALLKKYPQDITI